MSWPLFSPDSWQGPAQRIHSPVFCPNPPTEEEAAAQGTARAVPAAALERQAIGSLGTGGAAAGGPAGGDDGGLEGGPAAVAPAADPCVANGQASGDALAQEAAQAVPAAADEAGPSQTAPTRSLR